MDEKRERTQANKQSRNKTLTDPSKCMNCALVSAGQSSSLLNSRRSPEPTNACQPTRFYTARLSPSTKLGASRSTFSSITVPMHKRCWSMRLTLSSTATLHELQRFHDDMGGAVFVRSLQLRHDLAGAPALEG
jgi:hypothetical protein